MSRIDLGSLDSDEIGKLMRLLAGTDVEECEIEHGDLRIALKRTPEQSVRLPVAELKAEGERAPAEEPKAILAPAVGVFYRSEDRSDAPAVDVGTAVKAGDVLGVIEVMGVPHPVHSTRDGVIAAFAVEDGEPVEYGQPLISFRA